MDTGGGIVIDKQGNIIVVGSFSDQTIAFDNNILPGPAACENTFVVKLDPMNNVIWAKVPAQGYGNNGGNAISCDEQNNIYFGGEFANTISFGNFTLSSPLNINIYTVKLDVNGSPVWATSADGESYDWLMGIFVDLSRTCRVGG